MIARVTVSIPGIPRQLVVEAVVLEVLLVPVVVGCRSRFERTIGKIAELLGMQ